MPSSNINLNVYLQNNINLLDNPLVEPFSPEPPGLRPTEGWCSAPGGPPACCWRPAYISGTIFSATQQREPPWKPTDQAREQSVSNYTSLTTTAMWSMSTCLKAAVTRSMLLECCASPFRCPGPSCQTKSGRPGDRDPPRDH